MIKGVMGIHPSLNRCRPNTKGRAGCVCVCSGYLSGRELLFCGKHHLHNTGVGKLSSSDKRNKHCKSESGDLEDLEWLMSKPAQTHPSYTSAEKLHSE